MGQTHYNKNTCQKKSELQSYTDNVQSSKKDVKYSFKVLMDIL